MGVDGNGERLRVRVVAQLQPDAVFGRNGARYSASWYMTATATAPASK